jgi:DNA-binding MarR family transcriptional regulator
VQRLIDDMIDMGLVRTRPNPEHKRSVLIELTRAGKAQTEAIARIELPLLTQLFEGMSERDLAATARVLTGLAATLSPEALKQVPLEPANVVKSVRRKSKQESEK